MVAIAVSIWSSFFSGGYSAAGSGPSSASYLRPDGVSYYLRPDGTSYYLRP